MDRDWGGVPFSEDSSRLEETPTANRRVCINHGSTLNGGNGYSSTKHVCTRSQRMSKPLVDLDEGAAQFSGGSTHFWGR